ncbi:MAG: hypothetical protein WC246_03830 [Candidatus Paceibacterota bacterium]
MEKIQNVKIKIMDALRAWGTFYVFRPPLFVVGCYSLWITVSDDRQKQLSTEQSLVK